MKNIEQCPSLAERAFIRRAKSRGWHVLRAGWPDYMLVKSNTHGGMEFLAVEVKQDHDNDQLRESQKLMTAALVLQGIPVHVWSADSHTLRKIDRADAQATMDLYFRSIEQEKARNGLHELQQFGVLVRYDL